MLRLTGSVTIPLLSLVILLTVPPTPLRAEPVVYELDTQANAELRITLQADDGVALAADTVVLPLPGGVISGDLVGTFSPQLTVNRIEYPFNESLDFVVGTAAIPVSLDLDGFVAWENLSNNVVTLTQQKDLMTNNVNDASFTGLIESPTGNLAFSVDETALADPGADTRLKCVQSCIPSEDAIRFFFDALDSLAIDNRDAPGNPDFTTRMGTYRVNLGEAGGITWRLLVSVRYEATSYAPLPSSPVPTGSAAMLLSVMLATSGVWARHRRRRPTG